MTRAVILAFALVGVGAGCRGNISADPPVHTPWDDMWRQQKYKPQKEVRSDEMKKIFPDGRTMRPIPEGTVPVGYLKEDDAYWRGKNPDGSFVAKAPIEVTEKTLRRGQQRFNIFCAPCHDRAGSGKGIVVQRGFHLPVDLASEHTRTIGDGEIFDIISNGVRNMPAYGAQIPEDDRWAIALWVRVLQRSQSATLADVPAEQRDHIKASSANGAN